MSAVPIAVCVAQTVYDALRVGRWLWHRRSLRARYQMYEASVRRFEGRNVLAAAQRVVVNAEKKRLYLKMLKLWGNGGENLRDANPLQGVLASMAAVRVRQTDLEQADLNAVIGGLDAELGGTGGAQALLDAGL